MYFYFIIAASIVIDVATKTAIRANLDLGETTELWGVVPLINLENHGTSGNLFHGYGRWLALLVLILAAVAFYLRSKGKFRTPPMQAGLALVIGGAIGNAIDRVVYNRVTDFLHFSDQATMNFADIWVYSGVIVLVVAQIVQAFKPPSKARKGADLT
ncbi:signal peptidase II [Cohnella caldifontis]|uniref:signal peptidase II n=1 Tax=Cohnella caldifontis TaxID=3027471 RepID=UPI0023EDEDF5|nr:signal peptidase II [Cohnella sp. YIM B05605]